MKTAYLVLSDSDKKLVSAEEVSHEQYSQIFQCPCCCATLTFRQGYYRQGRQVDATFVHPEGNISDCPMRVDFSSSTHDKSALDLINRGQNSKKLEKAFLDCFNTYIDCPLNRITEDFSGFNGRYVFIGGPMFHDARWELRKQVQFNKIPGNTHEDPDLLMSALMLVLGASQSRLFIENKINELKEWLMDTDEVNNHFRIKIEAINLNLTVKQCIDNHCYQLGKLHNYICNSISEAGRMKILDTVFFGDKKLPAPAQQIKKKTDIKFRLSHGIDVYSDAEGTLWDEKHVNQLRKERIEYLQKFTTTIIEEFLSDPKFIKECFVDLYQGKQTIYTEFIGHVLSQYFDAIKLYDWTRIPSFYN